MANATRFSLWTEAIARMERAIEELDQAGASLKDIRMGDLDSGGWRRATIHQLVMDAEGLLAELRSAECDDCGHAIAKHGDRYGCEYERGDVEMSTRDGGSVMAAAGPCHCRWGLQEATS